jgi:hypothetical protein
VFHGSRVQISEPGPVILNELFGFLILPGQFQQIRWMKRAGNATYMGEKVLVGKPE